MNKVGMHGIRVPIECISLFNTSSTHAEHVWSAIKNVGTNMFRKTGEVTWEYLVAFGVTVGGRERHGDIVADRLAVDFCSTAIDQSKRAT